MTDRAGQLGAALGPEGDARQGGAEYQRDCSSGDAGRTGHAGSGSWTGVGSAPAPARARAGGQAARQREQRRAGSARAGAAAAPRCAARQVEEAAAVRLEARAADVHRRGRSPFAAWRSPRGRPGPRVRPPPRRRGPCRRPRAARALAPVGAALDGGGDHVAAVGVLVEVGREVVLAPCAAPRSSSCRSSLPSRAQSLHDRSALAKAGRGQHQQGQSARADEDVLRLGSSDSRGLGLLPQRRFPLRGS